MPHRSQYFFSVLVLEVFALINAYFVDLKGGSVDSARFQDLANEWAESPSFEVAFDAEFYVQFLGSFFWLFGSSEFLAAQMNIAALVGASVYAIKLVELHVGRDDKHYAMIFPIMLWPSLVTRATTTLREPIMILVVMMSAYFATKYVNDSRLSDIFKAMTALFVGGLFHKGLAVVFAVFIVFGLPRLRLADPAAQKVRSVGQRVAMTALGLAVLFGLVVGFGGERGLQPLVTAATGDTAYATRVIEYKVNRDFRTTYNAPIDAANPVSLVLSIPKNWAYYNFAPFPWQVRNSLDVLAVAEAAFRLLTFMLAARLWYRSDRILRVLLRPVFILHLSTMAIFAAGTQNYGTASRHHLVTVGFSVIYFYLSIFHARKQRQSGSQRRPGGRRDRRIAQGRDHVDV